MRKMSSAPKTGERILILHPIMAFSGWDRDSRSDMWEKVGERVSTCFWYDNKRWSEWCGSMRSSSTEHIEPLGWWPEDVLR